MNDFYNFEDYEIKIANYLENKMSPEEEEAFMLELGSNKDLRKQFEDELLTTALLQDEQGGQEALNNALLQPSATTAPDKSLMPLSPGSKVLYLFNRYKNIAAVLLLTLSTALVIILLTNKKKSSRPIETSSIKDSGTNKNDSNINIISGNIDTLKRDDKLTEALFRKFYAAYIAGINDPAALNMYYEDYKAGRFEEVISATDNDFLQGGNIDELPLLKQYMNLYKGLSYLGKNEPENALARFDSVMLSSPEISDQYYAAKWYALLASWLKTGDITNALKRGAQIVTRDSPYKQQAEQFMQKLNSIRASE